MVLPESHSTPLPLDHNKLKNAYAKSNRRMFFMDYDGTLSPIVEKPDEAVPSEELKLLLKQLSDDKKNRIYIISGRDRNSLGGWLGDLRLGMSAEHGCFLKTITAPSDDSLPEVGEWKDLVKEDGVDVSWRDKVIEVFNSYAKKLQGAVVECKEYAITFHYRQSTKGDSKEVVKELREAMDELTKQYATLNVLKGKKSVEARLRGVNKGVIIRHILDDTKREGVNFVFSIGDDLTDEDMYAELQADKELTGVFTCTVNFRGSKAGSSVDNQKQVLKVLQELAAISKGTS